MPSPADVRPEFSKWLLHRRMTYGLSQRELADHLGVGERTVRAWEAGEIRPSGRSLRRIAAAAGVPVGGLLDAAAFDGHT